MAPPQARTRIKMQTGSGRRIHLRRLIVTVYLSLVFVALIASAVQSDDDNEISLSNYTRAGNPLKAQDYVTTTLRTAQDGVQFVSADRKTRALPPRQRPIASSTHAHAPNSALSFAIEPPALVEYSNSTGATIHCRPRTSGPQVAQQAADRVTISWRRVIKSSASPEVADGFEEVEIARYTTGKRLADLKKAHVRRDGALVLPAKFQQQQQQRHSATYRCCLIDSHGHSICSRQVRTRAVPDSQIALQVYDTLARPNTMATLKCQTTSAHSSGALEFTGWLKDDKLLAAPNEPELIRRLRKTNNNHYFPGAQVNRGRSATINQLGDLQLQAAQAVDSMARDNHLKYLATSRGELVVRNVSRTTNDHLGVFKCRARNRLTGEQLISQVGGKLLLLDDPADRKSDANQASWSLPEVVQAHELDDVLLCASNLPLPVAWNSDNRLRPNTGSGPLLQWFKLVEGQRVALEPEVDGSLKQLDSCLLIAQVSAARHAGEYLCESSGGGQLSPVGVAPIDNSTRSGRRATSRSPLSKSFKLLVTPNKLDVQLHVRPTTSGPRNANIAPPYLPPPPSSLDSTTPTPSGLQVNFGSSIQIECLFKHTGATLPLTIAWFQDSRLLFKSRLPPVENNSTSAKMEPTRSGGARLMQPEVIAIDSMGLNDRGYYQCFVYHSELDVHETSEDDDDDDTRQLREQLIKLKSTGDSGSNSSAAYLRQLQLESSDEFRRETQLFVARARQDNYLLSSSAANAHVYLDLVLSRPQLIARFTAPKMARTGDKLQLECGSTGFPLTKISWFLDSFLIATSGSTTADDYQVLAEPEITYASGATALDDQGDPEVDWVTSGGLDGPPGGSGLTPTINLPSKFAITSRIQSTGSQQRLISVQSQLVVTNLSEIDSGNYKCLAWNVYGQAEHSAHISIKRDLAEPEVEPKLRHYQPTSIILVAGQNGSLHCPLVVPAVASHQVSWFHAGQRLPSSHRQVVDSSSGQLIIHNVDPTQDAGQYNCQVLPSGQVNSSSSSSSSGQVQVTVQVAPLIDTQSLPEIVQANEGMRTKLVCSIVQGDHPIDIKWLRRVPESSYTNRTRARVKLVDGRVLVGYELMQNMQASGTSGDEDDDNNDDQVVSNQQLTSGDLITVHNLEDSCLLTFKQISHLDSGDYLCLAQNQLSLTRRQVRVVVNVAPSWSLEPPDQLHVQLGARLQLDCLAHGHPQPLATWRRSAGNVATSGAAELLPSSGLSRVHVLANGSLVIDSVEAADAGAWMCEQTNSIGSGLSKVTQMRVQVPPYFAAPPTHSKVRQVSGRVGGSAELKCQALGDQPMIVGWRKDSAGQVEVIDLVYDERRKVSSRVVSSSSFESTLQVSNLTRQDSGNYACVASNEFGTEELTLALLVQEPPEEPEVMRPIRAESRQATLTFRQPFDGNSPIRKYAIHYKQLATADLFALALDTNLTATSASAAGDYDWKQSVVDAIEMLPASTSGGADFQLPVASEPLKQLVNLNLCCLKPFTRYAVRVRAINDLGPSELLRPPVRFQTEEEAIGGPPQEVSVEPTGAHSLKVRWREPTRNLQNGLIRGYYIGYRALLGATNSGQPQAQQQQQIDSNEQYQYKNVQLDSLPALGATPTGSFFPLGPQPLLDWMGGPTHNLSLGPEVAANKQQVYSTYLTNLRRKSTYSIIVQAYNKIGAGPRSDQILVSTLDAAPPMSPALRLLSTGPNSAQFTWTARRFPVAGSGDSRPTSGDTWLPPEVVDQQQDNNNDDDDDPQAYYTLNYKIDTQVSGGGAGDQQALAAGVNQQQEWQQKRVTKSGVGGQGAQQERLIALSNLRCGSGYLAFMTATNSLGQSEPGETVKFATRGGVPMAPTDSESFLRVNSSYLVMKLSEWHDSGCLISSFLIKYKLADTPKWIVLEHQVHPTVQTTTISGSSMFSTRQSAQPPSKPGLTSGAAVALPIISGDSSSSSSSGSLSDLVLRNLIANANYKLQVEANSEAGSTLAEYEFETGNLTSALLNVHVNGLVASSSPNPLQSGGFVGKRSESTSGDHQNSAYGHSLTSGSGHLQKYANSGGGLWYARSQSAGVLSLTVIFVAASILMAITTLVLGFKSLVRMHKQHHHNSNNNSTELADDNMLVSALFCCTSSSGSSGSSAESSSSSSNSSACYQISTSGVAATTTSGGNNHHHHSLRNRAPLEHEHSFQDPIITSGAHCSLPSTDNMQTFYASANETGTSNNHLMLGADHQAQLNYACDTYADADFRSHHHQMVNSASLSALALRHNPYITPARNTLTLAPQQRQQFAARTQQHSHYAATLGRQQQHLATSGGQQPLKFNTNNTGNSLYGRLLNGGSGPHKMHLDLEQVSPSGAQNDSYQLFATNSFAQQPPATSGTSAATTSGYGGSPPPPPPLPVGAQDNTCGAGGACYATQNELHAVYSGHQAGANEQMHYHDAYAATGNNQALASDVAYGMIFGHECARD